MINEIIEKTKKYNVLLVDDEQATAKNQGELLKMFFLEVFIANDGQEAFDIYSKENIDIVFTDINMPNMDGIELIKSIKEINPLQYIVVISARQDIDIFKELINFGVHGFLTKPLQSDELLLSLKNMVKNFKYAINIKKSFQSNSSIDNILMYTDPLSNLYTKVKLDEYLSSGEKFTLILVDIDNMDQINCNYGYTIGDSVIQSASAILSQFQFDKCKIFRLFSDEFVLLFQEQTIENIENVSMKIIKTFDDKKIKTDVDEIDITCTIGISSGIGLDLVRKAHIAIKEARQIGKEKFYYFNNNSPLQQQKQKNLKWLKKTKKILKDNTLLPYYQPILDNTNNKVYQYEALARILEINRIVKPYYLLESAKLFNLMPSVTKLMVENVFKSISNDKNEFAINISKDDIKDNKFISFVIDKVKKYNINQSNIVFELLEDIFVDENDKIFKNIKLLQKEGFKIAIDDFGTYNLSFKALHGIKIDYIKINGVLIENILEDKKSVKIIESIIKLANSIDAKTIAESVSSKQIQEKVKKMGIDYSQGFFIGKPKQVPTFQ